MPAARAPRSTSRGRWPTPTRRWPWWPATTPSSTPWPRSCGGRPASAPARSRPSRKRESRNARPMSGDLAWLRTDDAATDVRGLSGERLEAVAKLWARAAREVGARFGGASMQPTISPGCEVRLRCGAAPALGDVIAYVHGDQVVVHRLVARRADRRWLLTRGDAHVAPDFPVPSSAAILGTVIAVGGTGGLGPVAPEPRAFPRTAALALCRAALAIHPRLCLLAVRALRFAERRLR